MNIRNKYKVSLGSKLRNKFNRCLYRLLRRDMVARMRAKDGFTWSKINTVLRSFGQKVIIQVETIPGKGQKLLFGEWKNRAEWLKAKDEQEKNNS